MKTITAGTVGVPDLDAIAKDYQPRNKPWESDEEAVMKRYYNRVPVEALMKQFGRSHGSICCKAQMMGLMRREGVPQ